MLSTAFIASWLDSELYCSTLLNVHSLHLCGATFENNDTDRQTHTQKNLIWNTQPFTHFTQLPELYKQNYCLPHFLLSYAKMQSNLLSLLFIRLSDLFCVLLLIFSFHVHCTYIVRMLSFVLESFSSSHSLFSIQNIVFSALFYKIFLFYRHTRTHIHFGLMLISYPCTCQTLELCMDWTDECAHA